MKTMLRMFFLTCCFSSFSTFSMDCFRLSEAYLNLTVITLEGTQSTLELSNYEELSAIKDDALNFLASGEATESLLAFLAEIRTSFPSLEQVSDQNLVLKIVREL